MTTIYHSTQRARERKVSGFGCTIALGSSLAAFAAVWLGTSLCAQTIVVPYEHSETDGNTINSSPSGDAGGIRNMLLLDASQFLSLTGPSYLTRFAYRPNGTPGPSGPRQATLKIFASTTQRTVATLSRNFDENVGEDYALVFDGNLTLSSSNLPAAGNTLQFDIVFPLARPFRYDPAAGNLLLEVQIPESHGAAFSWDAVQGSRAAAGVGGSTGATSGQFGSVIPVVQLSFEPAPRVSIRPSQVEVCWESIPNATYRVEWSSKPTPGEWQTLVDCIRSSGTSACATDAVVVGEPHKFYRVVRTDCTPQ